MMRFPCCWLFLAAVAFSAACRHAPPEDVAATVNGRAITYAEVDNQYQALVPAAEQSGSPDEIAIRKLEILRGLIDSQIMFQRAENQDLVAEDSDVDARVTEVRALYTQEEFQAFLEERSLTEEELRAQLRQDLSILKLFNKDITSHITITDQDVRDFYEANKARFHVPEPRFHLAQILVTPTASPGAVDPLSDQAQNDEQARAKIAAIQERLRQGEDFAMVAQAYSEDPNTAPGGGDIAVTESQLERASPEIRRTVRGLRPGQTSDIIRTEEGYLILKLIALEAAGQRELENPRVQQNIRETLLNRKDQLLKAAYYEVARNEADVVNYYAIRISEEKGAVSQK